MKINKVTTHWKGGTLLEADNPNGRTLLMDDSSKMGEGFGPKALMLASLAGCSGIDIGILLEKMRLTVDDFRIDTVGELTEEDPKYYHKVTVEYHFYGPELQESKIKKAVELSVEKYCGVMEMFRRFAQLDISIHYHKK